eukprot:g71278.t1
MFSASRAFQHVPSHVYTFPVRRLLVSRAGAGRGPIVAGRPDGVARGADRLPNGPLRTHRGLATEAKMDKTQPLYNTGDAMPEVYPRPMQWLHLYGAAGIFFLAGSALKAGSIDVKTATKEEKDFRHKIMQLHESVGLLMFTMIAPRVVFRLALAQPAYLPAPTIQTLAANVVHYALYGAMLFMPISGLGFGYLSGWGVPFFGLFDVPGCSKEEAETEFAKAWTNWLYNNHHLCGQALVYVLLPLHVGAALFNNFILRKRLLVRMNPFASKVVFPKK